MHLTLRVKSRKWRGAGRRFVVAYGAVRGASGLVSIGDADERRTTVAGGRAQARVARGGPPRAGRGGGRGARARVGREVPSAPQARRLRARSRRLHRRSARRRTPARRRVRAGRRGRVGRDGRAVSLGRALGRALFERGRGRGGRARAIRSGPSFTACASARTARARASSLTTRAAGASAAGCARSSGNSRLTDTGARRVSSRPKSLRSSTARPRSRTRGRLASRAGARPRERARRE